MTEDIVARLRGLSEKYGKIAYPHESEMVPALTEAADEIEKLRGQLAQDDVDISGLSRMGLECRAKVEELEAEIERLRKQVVYVEDMGR